MNGTKLDLPQILGYVGAVLLALSTWMPIIHVFGLGDLDFFAKGFGDGPLFLAVAAASFYFAYRRLYQSLVWTAAAAAIVLALSFYHVYQLLDLPESASRAVGGWTGSLLGGATDWVADKTIHYSWGWAVPGLGIISLAGAAFLGEMLPRSSKSVRRSDFSP